MGRALQLFTISHVSLGDTSGLKQHGERSDDMADRPGESPRRGDGPIKTRRAVAAHDQTFFLIT